MTSSIISIGLELATDDVVDVEHTANTSLLDYDIVLIRPNIKRFAVHSETYQDLPSYSDDFSARIRQADQHWRTEIKLACEAGRTVIVFLSELQSFWLGTGQTKNSGTGRLAQRHRIVEPYDSYKFLPIAPAMRATSGSAMRLADKGSEFLAPYWQQFGKRSFYRVTIPSTENSRPCILTRQRDYAVGTVTRPTKGNGFLLLLPDQDFCPDSFQAETDGEPDWTDEARQFAARFVAAIVALDRALRGTEEATPYPSWATSPQYVLPGEAPLQDELREIGVRLLSIQVEQAAIEQRLKETGSLRNLLFENGKRLEAAVIGALKIMGFSAVPFRDANSEFDVVFECAEGRLIGEVEGKDNKPINVDKLRQLSMNIQEDLQRDDIDVPAKGVLFGNGFRLVSPEEREEQFTPKCVNAAKAGSFALVTTSSLFQVAAALLEQPNDDLARSCREALLSGAGLTNLPDPAGAI